MNDVELKALSDRCICHPASRSIDDIEAAGEAISNLINQRNDLLDLLESYGIQPHSPTNTSAPAIAFFPCGSLGEDCEERTAK